MQALKRFFPLGCGGRRGDASFRCQCFFTQAQAFRLPLLPSASQGGKYFHAASMSHSVCRRVCTGSNRLAWNRMGGATRSLAGMTGWPPASALDSPPTNHTRGMTTRRKLFPPARVGSIRMDSERETSRTFQTGLVVHLLHLNAAAATCRTRVWPPATKERSSAVASSFLSTFDGLFLLIPLHTRCQCAAGVDA